MGTLKQFEFDTFKLRNERESKKLKMLMHEEDYKRLIKTKG